MAESDPADVRSPNDRGRALGALHALFGAFPLAYFVLAFLTDVAYSRTYNLQWQYFSIWLIVAGLIMGGLAILFGGVEWLMRRRTPHTHGGVHILLALVAWLLALLNAFIHSRDGWTAVVPEGLILSGIVALLMVGAAVFSAFEYGRRAR
jgi:uncharacterized membrane protein